MPGYNDACSFVDRADLALDVDARAIGRQLIVRVSGWGLLVPDASLPDPILGLLDEWPPEVSTRALVLLPESVDWVPMIDDVRYPPLPEPGARLPGTYVDA